MSGSGSIALERTLLAMTALAVVGDAILVPFYPQFFASRYGTTDPNHTGHYLAAMCVVVMLSLPVWARWLRGRPPLRLLVWTQCGAGLLCLYCANAPSLALFWVASLCMFALKASYLLIYPYLLALQGEERHADTIGLLTVIVRFGAIAGALIGGLVLQLGAAGWVFYAMAASDFAQMALCLPLKPAPQVAAAATHEAPADVPAPVLRLCLTMLVFHFGAYAARPFFALYWMQVSRIGSIAVSGIVYALPAAAALVALAVNRRRNVAVAELRRGFGGLVALGVIGLLLQATPSVPAILAGRCLFGWSLFQVTVALDALLFAVSSPARYAIDFSKANIAQNLGVIASSLAAGAVVAGGGALPFLIAAGAMALTPLALPRARMLPPLRIRLKETVS